MTRTISLLLLLLALCCPSLAQALITVTGKSEIWVAPDRIDFSVKLASENASPEAAVASNQAELAKLRKLLAEFALEPDSFQATDVELAHPWRDGEPLATFEAVRQCHFSLTDVGQRERLQA